MPRSAEQTATRRRIVSMRRAWRKRALQRCRRRLCWRCTRPTAPDSVPHEHRTTEPSAGFGGSMVVRCDYI